MIAGIALYTLLRFILHMSVCHGQRMLRTVIHADSAVLAESSGLRIMTVSAVNITALQKDCRPVARTIHAAERDDPVHNRFHQSNW